MRVVIQTEVSGLYETIWSAEMLTRTDRVRARKVMEAQALAVAFQTVAPERTFLVGTHDPLAQKARLAQVIGRDLLEKVRRAIVGATRGCVTSK